MLGAKVRPPYSFFGIATNHKKVGLITDDPANSTAGWPMICANPMRTAHNIHNSPIRYLPIVRPSR